MASARHLLTCDSQRGAIRPDAHLAVTVESAMSLISLLDPWEPSFVLVAVFVAVAVLSSCWPWLRKLGIGRMPGDVTLRLFGREYPFPFMSTLVLSILLSLLARAL